jgi:hypothetical protein
MFRLLYTAIFRTQFKGSFWYEMEISVLWIWEFSLKFLDEFLSRLIYVTCHAIEYNQNFIHLRYI